MIECTPDCKYKKLLEECEGKRQQEKTSELHKCKEQNKVKERRLKDLNKKVLLLTVITTVAATVIGEEVLEFIGEWLGLLEDFNLGGGGNTATGVFPAPSTLGVFALAALFPVRRRK